MPTDEEDKDVIVTLDEPADQKTPEELAAEKAIDDLVAADKAGKPDPEKPKAEGKPLTAEEGKEDLAAQLKAMSDTAAAERKAREAAEAAAREAQEAVKRSQGDVASKQALIVDGAIETITLERSQAKGAYKAAMEAGDYDAAAEAQDKLSMTAARLTRLQEAKAAIEANKGRQQPTHEGRVEKQAPKQQDAFEEAVSSLSPASQAWARRNPTCFTDPGTYKKVLAAHYSAVADDIAPDTPAYFEFLEERVGLRPKPAANDPQPAPKIRHGAPPTREAAGNGSRLQGNKITLTAAEREVAKFSGLTDQEYAAQLVRAERNGELSTSAR